MIISTEHLPRDLRIIGVIAFIVAIIRISAGIRISTGGYPVNAFLIDGIAYLGVGIAYFALAAGIAKKERWAWLLGTGFFSLLIILSIISFLLFPIDIFLTIIGLIIPTLFLTTFIKARESIITKNVSILPLILFIVGFIMSVPLNLYIIFFA